MYVEQLQCMTPFIGRLLPGTRINLRGWTILVCLLVGQVGTQHQSTQGPQLINALDAMHTSTKNM